MNLTVYLYANVYYKKNDVCSVSYTYDRTRKKNGEEEEEERKEKKLLNNDEKKIFSYSQVTSN